MRLKIIGITWRKTANDRDAWKLILKEVMVLHEPYSQWREKEKERALI
jgi:hypothetical protein